MRTSRCDSQEGTFYVIFGGLFNPVFSVLISLLLTRRDIQRQVRGQTEPVAGLWAAEKACLLPLAGPDYPACASQAVKVNPYSQVVFETNRYSVPVEYVGKQLVLRAFPFQIEILSLETQVASHPRCFGREQDILNALHYLDLLAQRPGAFEHALPLRQWRKQWPADYERLLAELQTRWPEGRGVREFIAVLKLHRQYPPEAVTRAIRQAIELGAAHLDGVQVCLRECHQLSTTPGAVDLSEHAHLAAVGQQPVDLNQYDQLLARR